VKEAFLLNKSESDPNFFARREEITAALGTRYGVTLYSERTISILMDTNPLIVEDTTPLEVVSSLALQTYYY